MTDERIWELAQLNIGYDRAVRPLDFARAIEREVQAARATAEQSRDSVDARRYRWLRDVSEPGICAFFLSVGKAFDGVKFKRETVDQAIDAQIDAAIESQRSGDGS